MPKHKKLPDLPSELIRLAVRDLRAIEKLKKYKVNMDIWHRPNGHCTVCFAGSVMARSLKIDPSIDVSPSNRVFSRDTEKKLRALNVFRVGLIHEALDEMGFNNVSHSPWAQIPSSIKVCSYMTDKKMFKNQMLKLADNLERVGF